MSCRFHPDLSAQPVGNSLYSLCRLAVCLSLCLSACGSDDGSGGGTPASKTIEVAGVWTDDFGTTETISDTIWDAKGSGFESKSTVVAFDNGANWAITRSSPEDAYTANKFSKRVWLEPADKTLRYCSVVFGLDTLELAKATTLTADSGDLDGKGCGGFPWTKLTAK